MPCCPAIRLFCGFKFSTRGRGCCVIVDLQSCEEQPFYRPRKVGGRSMLRCKIKSILKAILLQQPPQQTWEHRLGLRQHLQHSSNLYTPPPHYSILPRIVEPPRREASVEQFQMSNLISSKYASRVPCILPVTSAADRPVSVTGLLRQSTLANFQALRQEKVCREEC